MLAQFKADPGHIGMKGIRHHAGYHLNIG